MENLKSKLKVLNPKDENKFYWSCGCENNPITERLISKCSICGEHQKTSKNICTNQDAYDYIIELEKEQERMKAEFGEDFKIKIVSVFDWWAIFEYKGKKYKIYFNLDETDFLLIQEHDFNNLGKNKEVSPNFFPSLLIDILYAKCLNIKYRLTHFE